MSIYNASNLELYHYGVMGMKWGVRRYQPYGQGYQGKTVGKFVGKYTSSNAFRKLVEARNRHYDKKIAYAKNAAKLTREEAADEERIVKTARYEKGKKKGQRIYTDADLDHTKKFYADEVKFWNDRAARLQRKKNGVPSKEDRIRSAKILGDTVAAALAIGGIAYAVKTGRLQGLGNQASSIMNALKGNLKGSAQGLKGKLSRLFSRSVKQSAATGEQYLKLSKIDQMPMPIHQTTFAEAGVGQQATKGLLSQLKKFEHSGPSMSGPYGPRTPIDRVGPLGPGQFMRQQSSLADIGSGRLVRAGGSMGGASVTPPMPAKTPRLSRIGADSAVKTANARAAERVRMQGLQSRLSPGTELREIGGHITNTSNAAANRAKAAADAAMRKRLRQGVSRRTLAKLSPL